jgi:group II intron reverse transcriptase/maturase
MATRLPEAEGSASDEGPNGRESETNVSLGKEKRQMSRQLELPLESRGEAPRVQRSGEAGPATNADERSGTAALMERVVEHGNVKAALKRVRQNKGSSGVDGMTVNELPKHLAENWETIRVQLLAGTYQPKPVRQVEIPKSGGGVRKLGIPSVLDRFLQQSILQVLQPMFDPTFSEHSHGFRPGRRAHDAVCEAQRYIQEGTRVVVDVDLEKFFDRVNHDVLMGRLEKRIGDKRMLGLIRRYLTAGIMGNGVVMERYEGTPQGGPLSPLLANVLLDEVDKELEKRGLSFVRYADDLNVYVRSKRAGEDAMQTLRRLYASLRLRINEAKSAVARPQDRKFLGYSFWYDEEDQVRRRVAPKALEAMRDRVRDITGRTRGRSLKTVVAELRNYLPGWKEYFRLDETRSFQSLDAWIRRRLRLVQLKQWGRGSKVFRELRARGLSKRSAAEVAAHCKRWWRTARHVGLQTALPNSYFDRIGLPRLAS